MGAEVDIAAAVVSKLSMLEPLMGAALAINLAYLNIEKFQFRSKISETAKRLLADSVGANHESFRNVVWYQEIQSLSRQTDHDPPKLRLPRGCLWSWFYRFFFHWEIDRWFAILATGLSVYYLALGVAHDADITHIFAASVSGDKIVNEFIYAVIFLLWPMAMAAVAAYCTKQGGAFVAYQLKGFTSDIKEDALADVKKQSGEIAKAADAEKVK